MGWEGRSALVRNNADGALALTKVYLQFPLGGKIWGKPYCGAAVQTFAPAVTKEQNLGTANGSGATCRKSTLINYESIDLPADCGDLRYTTEHVCGYLRSMMTIVNG
ncbi:hypothetical protein K0M31_010006 [Melipona bicolor]|uniref:Uncharacterized protein n=1 Tax=Melipona bicolor TaxID=60889 RepID=A0AA40FM22_9HYME|nr:hypothetical protein K0M31_010006 [Melipona bicolor]